MSALETLRRVNAKLPPEESVALRVWVGVAVLASTIATLVQGVGGPALQVAATLGIAGAFVYSHHARFREGYLLKAFLAIAVVVAFADFLSTATGLGTTAPFSQVQVPLAELFLWVQVLHSLDVPARRDLLFSLVSSLVLMAVAGVLSRSSGLGLYIAVWAVASVTSLVLAYRSELGQLPALTPTVAHRPRAGRRAVDTRRLAATAAPVGAVVLLVALVGTAAFLVAPSAGAGRAVAFPSSLPSALSVPVPGGIANPSLGDGDPSKLESDPGGGRASFGYFGFSETLDTSLRGRPDRTLVMRVRASSPDFWRGQTFDRWDGRTWSLSDERPTVVSGSAPLELSPAEEEQRHGFEGEEFVQTVYVERSGPNLIFAAYDPRQLFFSDRRVFRLSDGTIRTGVQLEQGAVYTVVSRRPAVTETRLRLADQFGAPTPSALLERYTQLPDVPDRVRRLAAEVTATAPTTYDKVRALEAWMAANTEYSIDVPTPPRGADAVEQFLFVDRKGFCEQIGSALVVMLRSLGVPARLAVGYTPGERNPFTGLYEVRAEDAHSWAEVWFPGVGWQGFDPTAKVPFSGDEGSGAAGAGLLKYLTQRLPAVPGWVPIALGAALALGVAAVIVVLLVQAVLRRRERAARRWVEVFLDRLERAGAKRGHLRRPQQTPRAYVAALQRSVLPDERLSRVAAALEADSFSGEPASEDDRSFADRVLQEAEAANPVRG